MYPMISPLKDFQEKVQIETEDNTVITAVVHRSSAVVSDFYRGILNIDQGLVT